MAIVDEQVTPEIEGEDEISDGEAIYSALSAVFAESKKETVFRAAMAVQEGMAWDKVDADVREMFEDVGDELFGDEHDEEPDDEEKE